MQHTNRRARRPKSDRRSTAKVPPTYQTLCVQLMQYIADNGDFLDITTPGRAADSPDGGTPTRWLLVPIPEPILHRLETLGAEIEDLEDGGDREGDDGDLEPDGTDELSVVRPDVMHRIGLDDPNVRPHVCAPEGVAIVAHVAAWRPL